MLEKSAVLDLIDVPPTPLTTPAPMTSGVEYVAGQTEVRVPVFPLPDHPEGKQVFAPPFVLPLGLWTVIYTVQPLPDRTYVFGNVTYVNEAAAASIVENDSAQQGGPTWSTKIDNRVTDVNKMECNILLNLLTSSFPRIDPNSKPLSGDPTIVVVKDPIDG